MVKFIVFFIVFAIYGLFKAWLDGDFKKKKDKPKKAYLNLTSRLTDIKNKFLARKGQYIFLSQIILKTSTFIVSLLAIRFIPKDTFGNFVYAISIITVVLPFIGMGANQSLLRFGSILKSPKLKYNLYQYSMKWGMALSIIITVLLLYLSKPLTQNMPNSQLILQLLSGSIITIFLMEIIKSYARIQFLNKLYAKIQNVYSILYLVFGIIGIYTLQEKGYALVYLIVPLIVFIPFYKRTQKENIIKKKKIKINKKKFWSYGVFVSIGSIASFLLLSTDILFLGNMIDNPEYNIAGYKVASLIPLSLLMLPNSFLTTDFVHISKNYKNKRYLINYVKDYLLIFGTFSMLFFCIIFLFSEQIISTLFKYPGEIYGSIFIIFGISMIGSFILRMPFINILSALGKSKWNAFNALITLIINIILNYLLIQSFGLIGAAIATMMSLWISGLIALFYFLIYIKKL